MQSYFIDVQEFGQSEGKGLGLGTKLTYLKEVYEQIVRPMVREIKETMRSNNLINEAEMYCTDLEFRTDENGRMHDFIGDQSKKREDLV